MNATANATDTCVQRPRRQAAIAAMENIRRVREWEDMSESSKRFRECAAQIDAEFDAELKQRCVKTEDLELEDAALSSDDEDDEDDEYFSADDSFVSDDNVSEASEYVPGAEEAHAAEAEEDADEDMCVDEAGEEDEEKHDGEGEEKDEEDEEDEEEEEEEEEEEGEEGKKRTTTKVEMEVQEEMKKRWRKGVKSAR